MSHSSPQIQSVKWINAAPRTKNSDAAMPNGAATKCRKIFIGVAFMKHLASLALTIAALAAPVMAQEHEHGVNGLPDWYDPSCCSQNDCKPVEDKDIEFGINEHGNYARYKPTGHTFYRYQFKPSQDERFHVCINPNAAGNNGALCFYDRPGA